MFIDIETTIKAPVSKVWELYTEPAHIVHWNFASSDWHTTSAANDLKVGGKFSYRMESVDGKLGFDFWGMYTAIDMHKKLEYELGDGRKVSVSFNPEGEIIKLKQSFQAESENAAELQKKGWQAILENFRAYVEKQTKAKS